MVSAIIQARMNSSRLPGKIMLEVMGRPLLSYEIEQLRFSRKTNDIIIATTVNKDDDPVEEFARNEGLKCYRGSEDDVLDRYYKAAEQFDAMHIMRITGDCPFVQPDICDRVVREYFVSGADYVRTGESFAEGLDCEVMGVTALSRSWREAKLKSEREHVCVYMRNHPETFQLAVVENEIDDSRYRLSVDEEEDFLVVQRIIENLYGKHNTYITFTEIKSFLDAHPKTYKLNSHIIRNEGLLKSLQEDRHC